MSIISKEACFRYPNCTVDDVHDTLAQVYTLSLIHISEPTRH